MTDLIKTLPFLMLLAVAAPAFAQSETASDSATTNEEASDDAAATTEANPEGGDAMALSMGEPTQPEIYVEATFGDWELRCIRSQAEVDPCQLYQLLDDGNGNPVAEINIFALSAEEEPAAGATVITPLETLLTQQLSLSVDGGAARKYPFSWCSTVGCFSRIGFSNADVAGFKRGANATITIVPVAAADQRVNLNVSLKGFTAGYNAALERLAAAPAEE